MSSLETVVFRRGDLVFAEGDSVEESPYMYIIGSGKVQQRLSFQTNSHAKLRYCFPAEFNVDIDIDILFPTRLDVCEMT